MQNLVTKFISKQPASNIHYGNLLQIIYDTLKEYQKEIINDQFIGYQNVAVDLDLLISKLDTLLDILELEEKTSHIRSEYYLKLQRDFFLLLNEKLPSIYN